MFVMEPADERNKDHSHVAHKMKHKPMKFEDSNGIAHYYIRITIIAHTGHAWITAISKQIFNNYFPYSFLAFL